MMRILSFLEVCAYRSALRYLLWCKRDIQVEADTVEEVEAIGAAMVDNAEEAVEATTTTDALTTMGPPSEVKEGTTPLAIDDIPAQGTRLFASAGDPHHTVIFNLST